MPLVGRVAHPAARTCDTLRLTLPSPRGRRQQRSPTLQCRKNCLKMDEMHSVQQCQDILGGQREMIIYSIPSLNISYPNPAPSFTSCSSPPALCDVTKGNHALTVLRTNPSSQTGPMLALPPVTSSFLSVLNTQRVSSIK